MRGIGGVFGGSRADLTRAAAVVLGLVSTLTQAGALDPEPPAPPRLAEEVRVTPAGSLQFRYVASSTPHAESPDDTPTLGFDIRRLRTSLRATALDGRLTLFIQAESAPEQATLLDGWAGLAAGEHWVFRAGQIHLPFNREQQVTPQRQLAVDRSSISYNDNPDVGSRLQGVDATFTSEPDRVLFLFGEGLGEANTPFNDGVSDWSLTLRYDRLLIGESFEPFKQFTAPRGTPEGLMLGFGAHTQHLRGRGDRVALVTDLSYQNSGFNAFLSGSARVGEDSNARRPAEPESVFGVVAHAGLYATDDIEPFTRVEWATTSDRTHPDLNVFTLGVNWYIVGHVLKLTTDLSLALDGVGPAFDRPTDGLLRTPAGEDRLIFRVQMQVLF